MSKNIRLSKTRIKMGLQCHKSLYWRLYKPELIPETSEFTQAQFDEGKEVGLLAQKEFPNGVCIEGDYWDYEKVLELTGKAIEDGALTIFEAAVEYEGFFARIDILHRENTLSPWQLIEVKKSTSVKEDQIEDLAIQTWIANQSGLKIGSSWLMHINNKSIAPRLENFFVKEDLSSEVADIVPGLAKEMKKLVKIATQQENEPKVDIGPHCNEPYGCVFKEVCWKKIPQPSIFDFPRIGRKAWALYEDGKFSIERLSTSDLSKKHERVLEVYKTGKRFVDGNEIQKQTKEWKWPVYFLDFETVNPAIPIFNGTHAYEQIPFQFSCHVLSDLKGEIKHFEYLHKDSNDPRRPIAEALIKGIGPKGSIVAYNKKFEEGVLHRLAEQFPDLKEQLVNIAKRLVDPWPILEAAVYDKDFLGSFSLKSVAPALLGPEASYDGMIISDGGQASSAYIAVLKGTLAPENKKKLIAAMLEYCRKDTMATVELVNWLYRQTG